MPKRSKSSTMGKGIPAYVSLLCCAHTVIATIILSHTLCYIPEIKKYSADITLERNGLLEDVCIFPLVLYFY